MNENGSCSLEELYREYAQKLGRDALSEREEKQAVMDAVLTGKRVEPFASFIKAIVSLALDAKESQE